MTQPLDFTVHKISGSGGKRWFVVEKVAILCTSTVIASTNLFTKKKKKSQAGLASSQFAGFYAKMKQNTDCMIPYMKCPELAHLEMGISCEKYLRDFRGGDEML